MIGFERDQNLAIARPDRGIITEGRLSPAVSRYCPVPTPDRGGTIADGVFHVEKIFCSLPTACRQGRARANEIGPRRQFGKNPGRPSAQRERAANENKKQDKTRSMMQRPIETVEVIFTKSFEATVKRSVDRAKKLGVCFSPS